MTTLSPTPRRAKTIEEKWEGRRLFFWTLGQWFRAARQFLWLVLFAGAVVYCLASFAHGEMPFGHTVEQLFGTPP
jgi:hypothetical protein